MGAAFTNRLNVNKYLIFILCFFLIACEDSSNFAPVSDIADLGAFIKKKSIARVKVPNCATPKWLWPAEGKMVTAFSARNKGIDITGRRGESIRATAAGTVVYRGNGLRGYGNLIILKHNNVYLSAYAHNKVILVSMGQKVRQGQKIAEMGDTGADKIMLHFEIRRKSVPVNPLSLLAS